MICRSCGKKMMNDQAVVCVNCGMNPKVGKEYCPSCGDNTKAAQAICTKCGVSLTATDAWSTGAYMGLLVLSFGIPIFGWIFGGIQVRKAVAGSKKKEQAWQLVFSGIIGLLFTLFVL